MGYKRNYKAARRTSKAWRKGFGYAGAVSGAALGFILDRGYGAAAGYCLGKYLGRRAVNVRPRYRKRNVTGSNPKPPIYGTPYAPGEPRLGRPQVKKYFHYVPKIYYKKFRR